MFGIPWRTLGIGLLALVLSNGAWALYAVALRADVATAQAAQSKAETKRDALVRDLEAATGTLNNTNAALVITKESLRKVRVMLAACAEARASIRLAGEQAAARLDAELADANAALRALTDRYAAAMRDPDCLICMNRPVCPALLGP